ncbi:MAG: hypothetical protein ACSHXY_15355 [Alphaproteobacteria bacterium]
MKKFAALLTATLITAASGATAFAAAPDVYVVNFRNEKNTDSQTLDTKIYSAISSVGANIEHVVIDTTTAARWEKGAHEAFDRDIVPVFNKWVGLPGFAAVVDAKSKKVIGCVNPNTETDEMTQELKRMTAKASGTAIISRASINAKATECPPAYNTPPK